MKELPTPRPTYLLKRGSYDAPANRVEPGTPASLPPFSARLAAQPAWDWPAG